MQIECDVAIIGGGPGGATVGTLVAKYSPHLKVLILEREEFPRDHIGESQLPLIARILDEMGVWEKVEAANFPVKIGGTYRWGVKKEFWDIEFLAGGDFKDQDRPAKFEGQRLGTAFQVDRSIFDKILLDHAQSSGCEVRQPCGVREIQKTGDRVDGLVLANGDTVKATHYVDASGNSGILRRSMDVQVDYPTSLKNIAIWDYWQNAEWAVKIGVGGTRIQVLAQEIGWVWFIPLGPERTSIGYVVPAEHFKSLKKRPDELYYETLQKDEIVSKLLQTATPEGMVRTTRDWSFVSERLTGENWFLVGECAGFADPILSAGMSLTHMGARDVAYIIGAIDRKEYEPDWLKQTYSDNHRALIRQHIRFADFWYTSNGNFEDLLVHAQGIAADAGLKLNPESAWNWIAQGGFIDPNGSTDIGCFGTYTTKALLSTFTDQEPYYAIEGKTHFKLNLEGTSAVWVADFVEGRIHRHRAYKRGNQTLPMVKTIGWLAKALLQEKSYSEIRDLVKAEARSNNLSSDRYQGFWSEVIKSLETLVSYGWISVQTRDGSEPWPKLHADVSEVLHPNDDVAHLSHSASRVERPKTPSRAISAGKNTK